MPLAIAFLSLGLMSIGFNLNGNTATATPGSFDAGPDEPTIVWYDLVTHSNNSSQGRWSGFLFRAWSDGTVEARYRGFDVFDDTFGCGDGFTESNCPDTMGWFVYSSPNEGLNARADINRDEIVDSADIGMVLAAWGDAPRNNYPPSDCPLGLIP